MAQQIPQPGGRKSEDDSTGPPHFFSTRSWLSKRARRSTEPVTVLTFNFLFSSIKKATMALKVFSGVAPAPTSKRKAYFLLPFLNAAHVKLFLLCCISRFFFFQPHK